MKAADLAILIGNIDEKYIEESEKTVKTKLKTKTSELVWS